MDSYQSVSVDSLRIICPTTCCLVGSSSTRKTSFLLDLLKYRDQVFSEKISKIIFCYGQYQEAYKTFMDENPGVAVFLEGFDPDKVDALISENSNSVLCIDDMFNLFEKGPNAQRLVDFFVKRSTHEHVNVFFVMHNLFVRNSPALRTVQINTKILIIFQNLRDQSSIAILSRQIYPGHGKFLVQAHRDAMLMEKPYKYLLINLDPRFTHNKLRVCTGILPTEQLVSYVPDF